MMRRLKSISHLSLLPCLSHLSHLFRFSHLALSASLFMSVTEVSALSVAPMSIKALAERSTLVVRGEVVAQRVIQDTLFEGQAPRPFTLSEVKVEACWLKAKSYKELPCPERVIVRQLGGALPAQEGAQEGAQGDTPPLTLSVAGFSPLPSSWSGALFLTPKWSAPSALQGREATYAPSIIKPEGAPLPVMVIEGGPLGVRSEGLEELQKALQEALPSPAQARPISDR